MPKRTGRRSAVRDRARAIRDNGPDQGLSLGMAIAIGLLVGLIPAALILVASARSAPAPEPEPTAFMVAARTVAPPTPTKRATLRATPTPWPLDLWTRMVTLPTPEGGWIEVDVDVPVEDPDPVLPSPTASQAPRITPTPTPEPEIVSPEEIARIQERAQAEVAAEAAQATPVPSAGTGQLGPTVPPMVRRWESLILAACERYKVDPNLIAALMMTESGGNPQALSRAGAIGLMQIMNGPWDPAANIRLGTAIMADNLRRYGGRVDLALAGYNAGNGAVAKYGGIPPYRETRDHVFRVLLRYELYRTG